MFAILKDHGCTYQEFFQFQQIIMYEIIAMVLEDIYDLVGINLRTFKYTECCQGNYSYRTIGNLATGRGK